MKSKSIFDIVSAEISTLVNDGVTITAETIEGVSDSIESKIKKRRSVYARKYPTLTTMLAVLGVTLTYYGMERIIAATPLLQDRPLLVLIVGLFFLVITGRLIGQSYAS